MLPEVHLTDRIPRILHQHFLAGDAAIPPRIREIRDKLRAANPGWSYSFWDNERAETFIRETYGEPVLSRYLRIRPEYYAARSDLLRYLALYAQGGVYLDVKSICTLPLDEAVQGVGTYLLMSWGRGSEYRELAHLPEGEYLQWALVSAPGHPFLRQVILSVLENIDSYASWRDGVGKMGTLRLSGPIAYTRAIHPLRPVHQHVYLKSPAERGFVYTVLAEDMTHRAVYGADSHYTALDMPLTDVSGADTFVRETIERVNGLPGIASLRRSLRPLWRHLRVLIFRRPT